MLNRKTFLHIVCVSLLLVFACVPLSALTGYTRMVLDLVALEKGAKEAGDPRLGIYTIGNTVEYRQIPLALLRDPTIPLDKTKKLLVICRQHGDEPASTEAALDFIRFLTTTKEESRKAILKQVSFFIVPMANPDGAERFQRRNAAGMDLNRDWVGQTQPETRGIAAAVRMYHPDAVIDAHELAPGNHQSDFVEAVSERAGASASVAAGNRALQSIVLKTLKVYGQAPGRVESVTPRQPILAHRFFAVTLGVPSVLFETKQAGSRAYDMGTRKDIHLAGMMAVARYLAGDDFADIDRMLAKQAREAAEAATLRRSRTQAQLPSRSGKTKRWASKTKHPHRR